MCLGNALGTYIDADMSFLTLRKVSMARILIHINVRKGLTKDMELSWGGKTLCRIWIMRGFLSSFTDVISMDIFPMKASSLCRIEEVEAPRRH
jgi:hypothetical protein